MDVVEVQPEPASLVLSLRDIGYSPEAAVADIVDNSVAAQAAQIAIRADWNDGEPYMCIVDDGCGMSRGELISAMRPGCRSPLDVRDAADLGRFGLGLKTASFAMARSLLVASRRDPDEDFAVAKWDLDRVVEEQRWNLRVGDEEALPEFVHGLLPQGTGTIVLWQKVDRMVDSTARTRGRHEFERKLEVIDEHLSLVFHRFLEARQPPVTSQKLSIRINGTDVASQNPFRSGGTQTHPVEHLQIDNQRIDVQASILPHHSRLNVDEYKRLAGSSGYVRNQGFYVYRNFRLIISGTWFRLRPQKELSRLVRVRVDIPNALDHLWTIDVRKSRASLPLAVRNRLDGLLERMIESGERVYTRRVRPTPSPGNGEPLWIRETRNGSIHYAINRDHPLLQCAVSSLDNNARRKLKSLLDMVSANFPAEMFYSDFAGDPKAVEMGDEGHLDTRAVVDLIRRLREQEFTDAEIRSMLEVTRPWAEHMDDFDDWLEEAGN